MNNLKFLSLLITITLFSGKKQHNQYLIHSKNGQVGYSCSKIKFSRIKYKLGKNPIKAAFKSASLRKDIKHRGLKLIDQENNKIQTSYAHLIGKEIPHEFSFDTPSNLLDNCNWRSELIQLHREDSVI